MSTGTEPTKDERGPHYDARELDLVSLKALAHPLRIQIIDMLSTYGSFTASGLADRLGESSGATSYHLRQLEKHGFVREVEGRGTGRERWWERTPGALNIGSEEANGSPAGRSAAMVVYRQMHYLQEQQLMDFIERGGDELTEEWADPSTVTTAYTRLTTQQLQDFVDEFGALMEKYIIANKEQRVAGSRPVQIDFHAFPVLDGEIAGEDTTL